MRTNFPFLASLVTAAVVAAAPARGAESATLTTFAADGQTTFALSLAADAPQAELDAVDVVVLFDTSASQQGPYRESGLAALESMLAGLRPSDRVLIGAVDLDAVWLMKGFAAANGPEVAQAIAALRERAPLGSTNMVRGLQAAIDQLEQAKSTSRAITYIGDGASMANMLDADTVRPLIDRLRATRTPASSYAIGPEVDAQALAMLANQSGGNLYSAEPLAWADEAAGVTLERAGQENKRAAQAVGKHLAKWARCAVLWPSAAQLPDQLGQVYPSPVPPLRADRQTVLIGQTSASLTSPIAVQVTAAAADGSAQNYTWSVEAQPSQSENAYLVELVSAAERDGGLTLPTVGGEGLAEAARLVGARADQLTQVAERAVAAGDRATAGRIAQAVLRSDPGNVQARTVQAVVESDDPFGGDPFTESASTDAAEEVEAAPTEEAPAEEPAAAPVEAAAPPPAPAPTTQGDITLQGQAFEPPAGDLGAIDRGVRGSFLDEVEQELRVFQQMLEREITNTAISARDRMTAEPLVVIQDLKLALESLKKTPNLDAAKRAELVDKLEIALREATHRAALKDEIDRQTQASLAAVREASLLNERLIRSIEREKQLMERFDALMDERKYVEAEQVAEIVEEIDPDSVNSRMATLQARHVRHKYLMDVARSTRHAAAWDTLFQIELSHIPFPDNPPIVYPEAPVWEELSKRRKARYASVDLKSQGEAESRIYAALRKPLLSPLDFIDTPLIQIMNSLSTEYDIPIQFDNTALEAAASSSETEVTVNLNNVSLRSALDLMLKDVELTYIVDNEVMLITTEEEARTRLQVKVYPVADLVLPIIDLGVGGGGGGLGGGGNGGGGGFGGGGQGGGGGFGGGGGGFGGGGGGFGGGGQGGGGGGGFFAVPDRVNASDPRASAVSATVAPEGDAPAPTSTTAPAASLDPAASTAPRVNGIEIDSSKSPQDFWTQHFTTKQENPEVVRRAVTRLVKDKHYDHAIALIQAALSHGQAQSWMYESLGIAMELDGRPKGDIERAIMSACDFSTSPDELMLIGRYLAHMGMDGRALDVYRQVVKAAPLYQEAYALGLQAAQRADDVAGIRWATTGILEQAWPANQEAVRNAALRIAKATLDKLKAQGDQATFDAFQAELDAALVRDCVVKVTWSGDADVDLIVEEPAGTACSLQEPRTVSGGVWLGDSYAGAGEAPTEGFSETYICPEGFAGKYRVRIRKVWGDLVAGRVTVDVYKNFRSATEQHERQHISVGDDDAAVVFDLEKGRRTEQLADVQLAAAVGRQQAIQGAVLAQQLGSLADPGIIPDRSNLDPINLRRALALARGGGQVGFMPVITTLTDGTQLFATAVVSADRRYVRITTSPNFTGIGNVTTFTFAGPGLPLPQDDGNGDGGGGGNGGGN